MLLMLCSGQPWAAKTKQFLRLAFACLFLLSLAAQPLRSLVGNRWPLLKQGIFALPYTAHRWTMFTVLPEQLLEPSVELRNGQQMPLKDVAAWPAPGFEQLRTVSLFSFHNPQAVALFYCQAHPEFLAIHLKVWQKQNVAPPWQKHYVPAPPRRFVCDRREFE